MVVGSDCATELRTMLGERELPPYARPRAARAWLVAGGAPPRRVILP
jgi:S-DNA-T family DNA segregation ATPase FtsK/SpoIIIE